MGAPSVYNIPIDVAILKTWALSWALYMRQVLQWQGGFQAHPRHAQFRFDFHHSQ
jgi:hypothetical protein